MILNGEVSFIGSKVIKGKEKVYSKAVFVDEHGGTLEVSTDSMDAVQRASILVLPQFSKVEVSIDVIQGKYPSYILRTFEVV